MRIAMLPSLLAPVAAGQCFGGAEMAALDLTEALAALGHELWLIGVKGSQARGARTLLAPPTPAFVPGEEVRLILEPFPEVLAALPAGLDVIHAHLNDPGALLSLDAYARAHPSVRVLSTLHLSAVFPSTTAVVQELLGRGSPVCFTAPSAFAAHSYGVEGIRVIPNGIDLSRIAFHARPDPDLHLAWAGRRAPEKGLDAAIRIAHGAGSVLEVAALSPPVGPSPPQVVERGRLPREEVPGFLGRAAATLLTSSIAEAHPLVAIESLAAGTPVVGFAVGGLPEIVDEATGILVAPGDVEAAIRAVSQTSALDRRACRAKAERCFDRQRATQAYLQSYALGPKRSGPH